MANVGDRVLAWWPAEQDWFYPGVVCAANGGKLDIQYDDGGRAEVDAGEVFPLNLGVGHRVYGNWKSGGQYFAGQIASATGNAINIDYDDGDKESTTVSMVRVNRADLN